MAPEPGEQENKRLSSPSDIAAKAEQIYAEKFKETYERDFPRHYVAIDIRNSKAYVGLQSSDALIEGRKNSPNGIFHLIRVGTRAAFTTTRSGNHTDWWAPKGA